MGEKRIKMTFVQVQIPYYGYEHHGWQVCSNKNLKNENKVTQICIQSSHK